MKYCTHCGAELADEAVVCTGCGCPVEDSPQPSSNPAAKTVKKLPLKHIILIAVAAIVLIGAVVGVSVIINNARKQEICDALEGNSYSYTDYTSYTLTDLTFEEDNQCDWYKFYSYIDKELRFTLGYSIKLKGDDVYVIVGSDEIYKAEINSLGRVTALIDEETGDRYD